MKDTKTARDLLIDLFIYLFYGAFALMCVFPFYYIFINSISANNLVAQGKIMFYPQGVHFGNYVKVLQLRNLPNAVLVTLSRTILGTFLSVLCTAFVGYGVTRRELFHRKAVYRFFIVTMYFNAGLIPWYLNMRNLHLTNNFLAYIIGVISAFNLILV
jgi:ABC-type glycerol-3-phosphate transport system permease component